MSAQGRGGASGRDGAPGREGATGAGGDGSPAAALETRVAAAVRARRDDLVALTAALVACDTTARDAGTPPRDEAKLQELLAARLAALGADIDLWEPEPTGAGGLFVPPGLEFAGRPQLVARFAGDPTRCPRGRRSAGGPRPAADRATSTRSTWSRASSGRPTRSWRSSATACCSAAASTT